MRYVLFGVLLCAAAAGVYAVYVGLPVVFGRASRLLLARRAAGAHALVTTFDDGPGAALTPDVLQLLSRYGGRGTFFVLGRNVEGNRELVGRIAAEGHEICSHGYDHLNHWKVSPLRAIADIKRGWAAIDAALEARSGVYPFRPPEGKLNLVTLCYLLWKRAPVVYWTVDSSDTYTAGAPRDPGKVAAALEQRGGAVALYHDFDRRDASTRLYVTDSLERTLRAAEKLDMTAMTVGELLRRGRS